MADIDSRRVSDGSAATIEEYYEQFPKPAIVADYRLKGMQALLECRTRDWKDAREMNATVIVGEFIRQLGR